jgi:hypothetical protein
MGGYGPHLIATLNRHSQSLLLIAIVTQSHTVKLRSAAPIYSHIAWPQYIAKATRMVLVEQLNTKGSAYLLPIVQPATLSTTLPATLPKVGPLHSMVH